MDSLARSQNVNSGTRNKRYLDGVGTDGLRSHLSKLIGATASSTSSSDSQDLAFVPMVNAHSAAPMRLRAFRLLAMTSGLITRSVRSRPAHSDGKHAPRSMHSGEEQTGYERKVVDEEAEFGLVAGPVRRAVE